MPAKTVPPSITVTSFNCPHCGALAHQAWFDVYVQNEQRTTVPVRPAGLGGELYLKPAGKQIVTSTQVSNLNVSICFNCKKLSVWVDERLLYPSMRAGDEPNEDLPDDILRDYNEARSIVDLSPRGAAALLRLCIQKICMHLGEPGKNLDDDIANLVEKGLDPRVKTSMDIVRVTGNRFVHPGEINREDDHPVAIELFRLVNLIADIMISQPKHIKKLYEDVVPESKRKAIEERDGKTPGDD